MKSAGVNWALRELGLQPDADARAVKRAYATRLKITRPEDDPEGFQRLHEAYQAALDWTQSRERDADIGADIDGFAEDAQSGAMTRTLSQEALFDLLESQPAESSGVPPPAVFADRKPALEVVADIRSDASAAIFAEGMQPDGMQSDEPAQFDPDAFIDDCIALAMRSRDGELLTWLNAQPALWSLTQKTQIAPWLLHRLHERRPPIEARRFDALAEFFGLLDLHSGYDAHTIQRLRHRLQLTWEIETRQLRALAARSGQDGSSMAANLRQAGRILGQLSRPLHWPQALWAALVPGYPSAVRTFMLRLDFGNLDDLPMPLREDQIEFWNAAGDRLRFSKPRWAVSVVRLFAYTLAIALLSVLFSMIAPPESVFSTTSIAEVICTSFTTMLIAWLVYLVYDNFIRWQILPESAPARFPRLRAASIPLLAIVVMVVDRWLEQNGIGIAAAAVVLFLAVQRHRWRSGHPRGERIHLSIIQYLLLLICFVAVVTACVLGFVTPAITGVALALWALDMRKQRAALQN